MTYKCFRFNIVYNRCSYYSIFIGLKNCLIYKQDENVHRSARDFVLGIKDVRSKYYMNIRQCFEVVHNICTVDENFIGAPKFEIFLANYQNDNFSNIFIYLLLPIKLLLFQLCDSSWLHFVVSVW